MRYPSTRTHTRASRVSDIPAHTICRVSDIPAHTICRVSDIPAHTICTVPSHRSLKEPVEFQILSFFLAFQIFQCSSREYLTPVAGVFFEAENRRIFPKRISEKNLKSQLHLYWEWNHQSSVSIFSQPMFL